MVEFTITSSSTHPGLSPPVSNQIGSSEGIEVCRITLNRSVTVKIDQRIVCCTVVQVGPSECLEISCIHVRIAIGITVQTEEVIRCRRTKSKVCKHVRRRSAGDLVGLYRQPVITI